MHYDFGKADDRVSDDCAVAAGRYYAVIADIDIPY